MVVRLAPAMSVVVKKAAVLKVTLPVERPDVFQDDGGLIVYGPLYSADDWMAKLAESGLEYWTDYFELASSGGPVPDWCQVQLLLA
jgi:hypothetical protein